MESMPACMVGASSVVQVDSGARARVSGSHAGLCQYASVCTHTTYRCDRSNKVVGSLQIQLPHRASRFEFDSPLSSGVIPVCRQNLGQRLKTLLLRHQSPHQASKPKPFHDLKASQHLRVFRQGQTRLISSVHLRFRPDSSACPSGSGSLEVEQKEFKISVLMVSVTF